MSLTTRDLTVLSMYKIYLSPYVPNSDDPVQIINCPTNALQSNVRLISRVYSEAYGDDIVESAWLAFVCNAIDYKNVWSPYQTMQWELFDTHSPVNAKLLYTNHSRLKEFYARIFEWKLACDEVVMIMTDNFIGDWGYPRSEDFRFEYISEPD